MVSPVFGLRPVRAARLRTWKVPKPPRVTASPFFSALVTELITASTARAASALVISASLATASIRSVLFIRIYSLCGSCREMIDRVASWRACRQVWFRGLAGPVAGAPVIQGAPEGRKPEMQQWRAFPAHACPPRRRTCIAASVLYVAAILGGTLPAAAVATAAAHRHLGARGSQRTLQGQVQHLVDPLHRDDLQSVGDVGRDIGQVLAVLLRDHHGADAA